MTCPSASTAPSRSASGVASGSANSSARPGTPNHAASPVSHSDTSAPAASAVAATVNPWLQRSGVLGAAGDLDDEWSGHAHSLGWPACRSSCPTTSTPTARRWRGCSAPGRATGTATTRRSSPYQFGQELIFTHDGRPFFHYLSRAWIVDEDGEKVRDAALETGFLRCRPEGKLELLLAHNTGFVEIWYGEAEPAKFELVTDAVVRTESAKEYVAGKRLYGLVEGDLLYAYDMAAMGQALQPHTWARLQRQ